jgi:hypothetical protein
VHFVVHESYVDDGSRCVRVGHDVTQRLLCGAIQQSGGLRIEHEVIEFDPKLGGDSAAGESAEQVTEGRLETLLLQVRG